MPYSGRTKLQSIVLEWDSAGGIAGAVGCIMSPPGCFTNVQISCKPCVVSSSSVAWILLPSQMTLTPVFRELKPSPNLP